MVAQRAGTVKAMKLTEVKSVLTSVLAAALVVGAGTGVAQEKKQEGPKVRLGKLANQPAPELKKPDQSVAADGEIVGQLIDAATGEPVEGATIACGAVINDSGKGGGANAVTDARGRYRLLVPSPGIYNVWLKAFDKDRTKIAAADDGILVEARKVSKSRLHLVTGRAVSGKVVDPDGKPVASIVVSCHSPARPMSGGVESTKTKADGTFEFALHPGRACVYAIEPAANKRVGGAKSARAHVQVPITGDVAAVTLTLKESEAKFGDPAWLERSTPGTQIVGRGNPRTVTGIVVDGGGKPVGGAKVFRYDSPIVAANDKGEFSVEAEKGTQFIAYAFAPGYHVWFGTPTSGDVLKIVLERKEEKKVPPRPDNNEPKKAGAAQEKKQEALKVTLEELGKEPAKFHGKLIQVEGVIEQTHISNNKPEEFDYRLVVGKNGFLMAWCAGELSVSKGDPAQITGEFRHEPASANPFRILADSKQGKVEKTIPKRR
jgi:protocatechuate 3,4-dioxygenase beta subunit